jgi:sugar phosphate isomerase/epimerase
MRFCIRREIDFFNTEERLRRVQGIPIEIAFPRELEYFLEHRQKLMDVKRTLRRFSIPVRSVHAPHGDLAGNDFSNWAPVAIGFAEAVGAEIVVFHPETLSHRKGRDDQTTALQNIKREQERTGVLISLETFREKDRVLTPDEIMENHLPMVLDTSLIPKTEITWIMESYHTHVSNIHLSAVSEGAEQHACVRQFRPIDSDPFCLDILDRLHELGWNGLVTLEYLPWLSSKSMEDRLLLERIYQYSQAAAADTKR